MPEDYPRAPADGYYPVAEAMPDWYFTQSPPVVGSCLEVTGRDYVTTYWEMHPELAEKLAPILRRDHRVMNLRKKPFDHRRDKAA